MSAGGLSISEGVPSFGSLGVGTGLRLIRRALGGAITRRLGQWLPQSIYIGGDGGSRLTAGGVVLA